MTTGKKNVYKILFIISACFFALLVCAVGILYYIYKRKESSSNNDFDLSNLAKKCTNDNDKKNGYLCICSSSNSKQKICIKNDGSSLLFPSLSKQYPLPSALPATEIDPFRISIMNQDIGVFQNPFYPDSRVICLNNLKDTNNPRRLCFNIDEKEAFIFGPTDFSKTMITLDE